jgi:ATP-dependent exoDNAse (exonuclease V) alpha subunit
VVDFDPSSSRHFDHGYAVTSHSSQGLTADRVLVNIDTASHPDLINSRLAYVSVSRGRFSINLLRSIATDVPSPTRAVRTPMTDRRRNASREAALDFRV